MRGIPIAAGDKVVVWLTSGNHDELQFDDPYRFDVDRRPNPHVALRPWRPALLPRRAPREARGQGHVRGAPAPARVDRADRPRPPHPSRTSRTRFGRCPCASRRHETIPSRPTRRNHRMTDANLARLIEDGVTTVRLSYPDLHGIARGKEYPVAFFDHLVADGAAHCEAIMTVDLAHNVMSGFEHGFQDILARPDASTLARIPWDPDVAWCIADLERMGGEPVRMRLARGAEAGRRRVREARPRARPRPGARVLPVRARPGGGVGLPPLCRQPEPRLHGRLGGRSARRPARDAARLRRPRPWRLRRQPRVRARPVRDQPAPLRRALGVRPSLPLQDHGQGDVSPAWPPRHVHREAVERRRGLGLPPPHVARRRGRKQPPRTTRTATRASRSSPTISWPASWSTGRP